MGSVAMTAPVQGSLKKYTSMGVNLNATGDVWTVQNIPLTNYVVERFTIWGQSVTPSILLTASLRDAASGGGNSILGTMTGLNLVLNNALLGLEMIPFAGAAGSNRVINTSTLYFYVSVANGTALTANMTLYLRAL